VKFARIFRRLVADSPAENEPDLALTLNTLTCLLMKLGRHDDARTHA